MATLPESLAACEDVEGGGEEEMFFVALSRARDELLLSRPAEWRGKPVEPAPILERIAATLAADQIVWDPVATELEAITRCSAQSNSNTAPESDSPSATSPAKIDISLARLRQYQACPRQYYYRHVLKLPEGDADTAYRTFHRHLTETLDWLQEERSAGRAPTVADAQAMFRSMWPDSTPEQETALVRILRARADLLLNRAVDHFAPLRAPSASEILNANLESGTVQVRGDEVETRPDGSMRITQHVHRRPKKDDHTGESLALLRLAAKQRAAGSPVEIALHSTDTGETREIAEDRRWEPKRVEKYEKALQELAAGQYPARPSDSQCASCPFFFICPA
jgi:CRISPR/Cas system-associated exonuclease Cas4 (RecB family)